MFFCFFLLTILLGHDLCGERNLAVHVKGGQDAAESLARRHAMKNMGEIIPDTNYYWLRSVEESRKKRSLRNLTQAFRMDEEVVWMEFQSPKLRVKRDPISIAYTEVTSYGELEDHHNRSTSEPVPAVNDPMWGHMWHISRTDDLNMRVEEAWKLGVTGKGVTVTILDDGIETDHPDLIQNYDSLSSTDVNDIDSDPTPHYDLSNSNRHGTRCAGQVAATANNSLCSVGIAFNAKIGGIRMLDGDVTDIVEAKSLAFNQEHINIYSSSWGPNDDGKTVDGPGKLTKVALKEGTLRGRSGKGSIFVWASGNGGRYKDNCNCDGYASSIFTITVSSTTEKGQIPWYSEACSATIATTYSSGSTWDKKIVTTDLNQGCTSEFSGTSASAPMASAIIALSLEANPALSWRDVQHIIVRTANPGNLKSADWRVNGLGRKVSHSYGYGLMDAEAMVKLARKWISVPDQQQCEVASPFANRVIPGRGNLTIELDVNACKGVRYLEHVISTIHVTAGRKRGDLRIYLYSPSGTRSTLLDNRPQDYSSIGFTFWPFMTTHSWGENPLGTWSLVIYNDADSKWASDAKYFSWSLRLYGTQEDPTTERTEDLKEGSIYDRTNQSIP